MDPLTAIGVASSVAGLLALGGEMISLLSKITSVNDAPDLARDAETEMKDISAALCHVQEFLNGQMAVPFQRRYYILVEQVFATLTGCVTAYSELEAIVDNLGIGASVMRVYDRTNSNQEIHQSVVRLRNLVEEAVLNNDNLSVRLSRLEGSRSLAPDNAAEPSIYSERDGNSDTATIQPNHPISYGAPISGNESFTIRFDFDRDLMVSRVYQRAISIPSDSHSESSITESTRRLAAFSIFSSQSLAEISNLSVYSMPISLGDIRKSSWYIDTAARPLITENNGFMVFVKTLLGRTINLEVGPRDTYEVLKKTAVWTI